MLSNNILDAAKTNRTLQLIQSGIKREDLEALAKYELAICFTILIIYHRGCVFGQQNVTGKNLYILQALCESYLSCNEFAEKTLRNLFHLRDFVYLMRYLRKKCTFGTHFMFSADILLRGLQRNFNGIHAEDFVKLVERFFANVNKALARYDEQEWELPPNLKTDTFVELIQDR